MIGSIGLFVLLQPDQPGPRVCVPTAESLGSAGLRHCGFRLLQLGGLTKHGPLSYGKHFMGPNLALSPLMVVIEAVSHLARLLSLTVRLWVNMMVSELLYGIFLGLTVALFLFAGNANPLGYVLAPVPLLSAISLSCTSSWPSCRRLCLRFCRSFI